MAVNDYTQLNMLGFGNGYSSMASMSFLGGGFGMDSFGIGNLLGGCGTGNYFQSCDGSYNYDAMAGYAVANVGVNCLFGFLGNVVQSRKANKAESPEVQLEALKTKQATLQSEVKTKTEAYNTAKTTYTNAQTAYTTNHAKIDAYTTTLQQTYEQYKAWLESTEDPKPAAPCSEADYKAADLARIEAERAEKEDASLKTAMEAAEKAMKSAEQAKEAKEAELAAINEQIEALEDVKNDDVLNKADGHGYQQTKLTDLNSLFKVDANGNESFFSDSVQSSHNDIRGAIAQYRLAKSDAEKQKWANRISILWNNLSQEDQKKNKDIISGINAMRINYPSLTFNNI